MYFHAVKNDSSQKRAYFDRFVYKAGFLEFYNVDGYIIYSVPIADVLSFKVE